MDLRGYYCLLVLICFTITSNDAADTGLKIMVGSCIVTKMEQHRTTPDRDHYCIRVGSFYVCRVWRCPSLSCTNDKAGVGNCRVCPGTCIDGGQIYQLGQRFRSVDGVNTCMCTANNIKRCSRRRRVTFLSLCLM